MANISAELAAILAAVLGRDVRGSIHDAIDKINKVSEVVLSTGTDITSSSSSSSGYYTASLYINTDTMELWKCVGTNAWESLGVLKGDAGEDGLDGNGIVSISKTGTSGLVDTYTITLDDEETYTFNVTNGANGQNGNKWYRGTGISGKSPTSSTYPQSGVSYAYVNDNYINPSEGAVYHCTSEGYANAALWVYDFTLSGGGSGGTSDYPDLTNKPQINSVELVGNKSASDLGLALASAVPTSTSQLTNDSGFINNTASNLTNYYTKTAVDTSLAGKVDVVSGKGLSTEDFTTSEKAKLATAKTSSDMLTSVASVESQTATGKIVDATVTKLWSNRYTTRVESTLLANTNEITIPASGHQAEFENDDATFEFMFEPNGTDTYPLVLAGYEITTTAGQGKVKLTIETAPTVDTQVAVDVTVYR